MLISSKFSPIFSSLHPISLKFCHYSSNIGVKKVVKAGLYNSRISIDSLNPIKNYQTNDLI